MRTSQARRTYNTHETYSLSVLVVRTSGSLPSRPMRMSLDTSYERVDVVEKALIKFYQHASPNPFWRVYQLTRRGARANA